MSRSRPLRKMMSTLVLATLVSAAWASVPASSVSSPCWAWAEESPPACTLPPRDVAPKPVEEAAPPSRGPTAAPNGGVLHARDAQDVALVDVDAIQAQIRKHRGHPLILHFWASWCGPCLMELPLVNRLAERMRGAGAEVLSVSLDDPAQRSGHVLDVLRSRAPALTAAVARIEDPDRFVAAFHGVKGQPWEGSIPALFAFDRDGALARQHVGEASAEDLAALARGAGVVEPKAKAKERPPRRARRSPSPGGASPATR